MSGNTIESAMKYLGLASQPTQGDMIYALGRLAQRIQERTSKGLNYLEQAFAPYSTKGPFYFAPYGKSRLERQQVALHHSRFYGGSRKRGGTSVKYASYAAYKAARGVTAPDLGGMDGTLLSNLQVNVSAKFDVDTALSISLEAYPNTVAQGAVGIYTDPASKIARGHNNGVASRNLPQRRFIDVSTRDVELMKEDIAVRINSRLQKVIDKLQ